MKKYYVKYIGQNWYVIKDRVFFGKGKRNEAHEFTLQEAVYFFNQSHQGDDTIYEVEAVPERKEIVLVA